MLVEEELLLRKSIIRLWGNDLVCKFFRMFHMRFRVEMQSVHQFYYLKSTRWMMHYSCKFVNNATDPPSSLNSINVSQRFQFWKQITCNSCWFTRNEPSLFFLFSMGMKSFVFRCCCCCCAFFTIQRTFSSSVIWLEEENFFHVISNAMQWNGSCINQNVKHFSLIVCIILSKVYVLYVLESNIILWDVMLEFLKTPARCMWTTDRWVMCMNIHTHMLTS